MRVFWKLLFQLSWLFYRVRTLPYRSSAPWYLRMHTNEGCRLDLDKLPYININALCLEPERPINILVLMIIVFVIPRVRFFNDWTVNFIQWFWEILKCQSQCAGDLVDVVDRAIGSWSPADIVVVTHERRRRTMGCILVPSRILDPLYGSKLL